MRFGLLISLSMSLFGATLGFGQDLSWPNRSALNLSADLESFARACERLEGISESIDEMPSVWRHSQGLKGLADRLSDNVAAGADFRSAKIAINNLLSNYAHLRAAFEDQYQEYVVLDRQRPVENSVLEAWFGVSEGADRIEETLNALNRPTSMRAPIRYKVQAKVESRPMTLQGTTRSAIFERCLVKLSPESERMWESVTLGKRVWNAPTGKPWNLEKVCTILALNSRLIEDTGTNIQFTLAGITADNAPYFIRERELHEVRHAIQDLMPTLLEGDQMAFTINGRRIVRELPISEESMMTVLHFNVKDAEKKYQISGDIAGYPFYLNLKTIRRATVEKFFAEFNTALPLGFNEFRLGDEQFVNDDPEDEQWDLQTITDEVMDVLEN